MGWSDDPGGVQWNATSLRSPQHVLYVNTAVIAQVNPSLWHVVGMCRHILKCVDQQCWLSPRSTGFLQKRCDTEMCIYIYLPRGCNGINISCFSEPAFSISPQTDSSRKHAPLSTDLSRLCCPKRRSWHGPINWSWTHEDQHRFSRPCLGLFW